MAIAKQARLIFSTKRTLYIYLYDSKCIDYSENAKCISGINEIKSYNFIHCERLYTVSVKNNEILEKVLEKIEKVHKNITWNSGEKPTEWEYVYDLHISGINILSDGIIAYTISPFEEYCIDGEEYLAYGEEQNEAVNHPQHYQGKNECIDVMIALFGLEAVKSFCKCNAYNYRFRADKKNGAEDIAKAEWYESKLIELEKGANK